MAYADKWDDYSGEFQILEEGKYVLELKEITGPFQQVNTFNPTEGPVDKYYWDFHVFQKDKQVLQEGNGEPFRYRMFISDAMGPNSHTMRILEALDAKPENGVGVAEWQQAAIGCLMEANVHIVESTSLLGEKKQKNKIDPRVDIQTIQTGEVKKEAKSKAAEVTPVKGAADGKLPF